MLTVFMIFDYNTFIICVLACVLFICHLHVNCFYFGVLIVYAVFDLWHIYYLYLVNVYMVFFIYDTFIVYILEFFIIYAIFLICDMFILILFWMLPQ